MAHKLNRNGALYLYGVVGGSYWDESGFSDEDVLAALQEMSGDIVVHINSAGGAAFQGIAIYNALKSHEGSVSIVVDALAASAASVIAMAGDTVTMGTGSMLMIHDPAGITIGTSKDHRKTAENLDSIGEAAAEIYAAKTGLSHDDVLALMAAETWMRGEEAVEKGFADAVVKTETMRAPIFDYSLFMKVPDAIRSSSSNRAEAVPGATAAHAAHSMEIRLMPGTNPTSPAPAPAPIVPTAEIDTKNVTNDIFSRCRSAKLTMEETDVILKDAGNDVVKAQDMIITTMASRDSGGEIRNAPPATVTADARDRFKTGVALALLSRANLQGGEVNEFTAMSLREIARTSLDLRGDKTAYRDPLMMVGAAFSPFMSGMHSTSDFVEILSGIANKSMLKGWGEAEETFEQWTSKGNLPDFKISKRLDLNMFPALTEVPEGGEYNYATIGEHGETVQLATYGKMFAITRQAIINDDMNAFTKIPGRMGRAAHRTIGNLVYGILTSNPVMGDGVQLFHANHKNLGTAAALSVASLNAGRASMALQKDPDGIAVGGLNIRPAHLLVPVELEGEARVLIESEFDPSKTQRTPNSVRNLANVISDARLSAASAAAWYLAGNPNVYDTIEVSYLNGNQSPTLEQREGWHVDGVEYKVRIDAGVKALDFRALHKNAGQ
jgi:ATP-dependent protease ClpP protease subunit